MSYNMLDMEFDYKEQIEYFESDVQRVYGAKVWTNTLKP